MKNFFYILSVIFLFISILGIFVVTFFYNPLNLMILIIFFTLSLSGILYFSQN